MSNKKTEELLTMSSEFLLSEYDKAKKAAQEITQNPDASDPSNNPLEQSTRRFYLRILRGLVLAKMEGITPPFNPGDKVESIKLTTPHRSEGEQPAIQKGGRYRVDEITYAPDVGWLISMHNLSQVALFKASDFKSFVQSDISSEQKAPV